MTNDPYLTAVARATMFSQAAAAAVYDGADTRVNPLTVTRNGPPHRATTRISLQGRGVLAIAEISMTREEVLAFPETLPACCVSARIELDEGARRSDQ